jgi:nucleoid-associated protein YgaU
MAGLEKAVIANTVTQANIPVMFNPTDYTVSQDINYAKAQIPGLSQPLLQFVNGNTATLEMELFLDTNEAVQINGKTIAAAGSDVRALTKQITNLMAIDPTTHAPPVLVFTWASLSFTCVLARAQQKFVMFLSDGTPVRARLQVTFNGYDNADTESKEVKRETADYSKSYTAAQGDNLSKIAAAYYGNAALWRPIGMANEIDDPMGLTVGQRLLIPQLPYQDPRTGKVVQ